MKILHLTDFHFSSESKHIQDQNKLIDALISDLEDVGKIDFLFFTGDLVQSGNKQGDFLQAKKLLLDSLSAKLKIEKDKIIICCGNHDIHRGQELQDTTDKIGSIDSDKQLEEFLKRQNGKSFQESLKNLKNYNEFQFQFYSSLTGSNCYLSDLYGIHKITIGNHRIGILTINSAWRAIDSKTDRGNLLFPVSILKAAIAQTSKDTAFRVLLMHHPLSDFKYWNSSDMEDAIYKDFHLLFSGHLHKNKQLLYLNEDEGTLCCQSAATLTLDSGTIGYSLIDVGIDTYDIEINKRQYDKKESTFVGTGNSIKDSIPVGEKKKEIITFRKALKKKYFSALERANELFILHETSDLGKGFTELFSNPILKNKTQAEIAKTQGETIIFQLSDIQKASSNYVIYGKDKSGRTSILYKILLDLLTEYSSYKIVPIYIDARDFKNSGKALDINKHIARYYEMNQANASALPSKYKVKLLIDNYEPSLQSFNDEVNQYLKNNKNVSFIAVGEERLASSFFSYSFDGRDFTNVYIHEISRGEVRTLANKWPNLSTEKREIILDKIFDVFTQLSIPINYWTVSLFIWIFEVNNDANFHNNFELIQLYIDNLLDRKKLALDKTFKLKFDDFKSYLAELSHFFMKDRSEVGYTATFSEIVKFTNDYRNSNKRFVIEVQEVIELIMKKNILRKVSDERYTFRLNGVFEYFIALYMTKNKKFCEEAINDDHYYLSFRNEFELYAGLVENGEEYLESILRKTKAISGNLHITYSKKSIDTQLSDKIAKQPEIDSTIAKLGNTFQKTLTDSEQDELINDLKPVKVDMSEVKVKRYYETLEDSSENLEKALYILARVYRNGNVQNENLNNTVLDYILDSACYLGFKLIDEAEEHKFGVNVEKLGAEKSKMLIQLIKNFMPIIVQTFLFDAIAQNDLERILQDKITELKKDSKNNQFKLVLLYFTLIDLNVSQHKDLLEEILDIIDSPILRHTALIKLYVYLLFKCNNKPALETTMKDRIRELTIKINPKRNKADFDKNLSKADKYVIGQNAKGKRGKTN